MIVLFLCIILTLKNAAQNVNDMESKMSEECKYKYDVKISKKCKILPKIILRHYVYFHKTQCKIDEVACNDK